MSEEESHQSAIGRMLDDHGPVLLQLAAASISHGLVHGRPIAVNESDFAAGLAAEGACFVTLKQFGELRGCVGSPRAYQPLITDVAANAFAAAFADSRFPRLKPAERMGLCLSVTVLGPPERLTFAHEAELRVQLRPHVDGLMIACEGRSALFLPQVWNALPTPGLFLEQLKAKAGLHSSIWYSGFEAWRFTAKAISSEALDRPETLWQ